MTRDQGKELAEHKAFTIATGVQVCFCDPRIPWQRGSNENSNGLLRQYLRKTVDFEPITQEQLDTNPAHLNTLPRKSLDWATPAQALAANVTTSPRDQRSLSIDATNAAQSITMLARDVPMRQLLHVDPLQARSPEIGRWLWALGQVRRNTLTAVSGLPANALDWEGPDGRDNAIGSLLYHIALIEMSWLFEEILQSQLPPDLAAEFPFDARDATGRITRVAGTPLERHLARLHPSRATLLESLLDMGEGGWRRPREPSDVDYRVTPEWAVFHLIEHEAGHAFQIRAIRRRAGRVLTT